MTFVVSPGGGGWELFGQERQIDSLWERFALALCAERKHMFLRDNGNSY